MIKELLIFLLVISVYDRIKDFKFELKRDITINTILFVDEVQESEEFIEFFQENDFPYKIITAGSLLGGWFTYKTFINSI